MAEYNLVYILDGKIYINLTNMCTNNCVFCIRNIKNDVAGADLFLNNEKVTADDVISQLKNFEGKFSSEVVFCGYGEPTLKLEVLKTVAKHIKDTYPGTVIRVNTNGHANYVFKRNVLPELKGIVDKFSVSLNAQNEKLYNDLSKPSFQGAYSVVLDFISQAVKEGFDTSASIVTGYKNYDVDVEKCIEITKSLGARFRERPWIENGY